MLGVNQTLSPDKRRKNNSSCVKDLSSNHKVSIGEKNPKVKKGKGGTKKLEKKRSLA